MRRKRKTIEDPQTFEDYYIIAFFRIEEGSGGRGIFDIRTGLMQRNALAIKQLSRVLDAVKEEICK